MLRFSRGVAIAGTADGVLIVQDPRESNDSKMRSTFLLALQILPVGIKDMTNILPPQIEPGL